MAQVEKDRGFNWFCDLLFDLVIERTENKNVPNEKDNQVPAMESQDSIPGVVDKGV